MTKEEAVDLLDNLKGMVEDNHGSDYDEAIKMAIEALKAQDVPDTTVGDTISRQAAIDALDVLCQEHRYKIPGKAETYSQYNEAWQDALERAEGVVGNLPPAQPEQRWIPVSSMKYPEENKPVLVTHVGRVGKFVSVDWVNPNTHIWNNTLNVTAWMEIPEPWKEE